MFDAFEEVYADPTLRGTEPTEASPDAMLLTRDGSGDRAQARELLTEAGSSYRALGMHSWADQALALSAAGAQRRS